MMSFARFVGDLRIGLERGARGCVPQCSTFGGELGRQAECNTILDPAAPLCLLMSVSSSSGSYTSLAVTFPSQAEGVRKDVGP